MQLNPRALASAGLCAQFARMRTRQTCKSRSRCNCNASAPEQCVIGLDQALCKDNSHWHAMGVQLWAVWRVCRLAIAPGVHCVRAECADMSTSTATVRRVCGRVCTRFGRPDTRLSGQTYGWSNMWTMCGRLWCSREDCFRTCHCCGRVHNGETMVIRWYFVSKYLNINVLAVSRF